MKILNAFLGIVSLLACAGLSADTIDISGTYETEVVYASDLPRDQRKYIFGVTPDLELTLTHEHSRVKGKISGDRKGIIDGIIDDKNVTFDFAFEVRGEGFIEGTGAWIVQQDGTLVGDFRIKDSKYGIVRGSWTLTKRE